MANISDVREGHVALVHDLDLGSPIEGWRKIDNSAIDAAEYLTTDTAPVSVTVGLAARP